MRAFIAIELSDEIKDTLEQAQSHLKYAGADVKWVDKNNVHLTLKFLGAVPENKLEEVKRALEGIAKSTKPFKLSIKGVGVFPNINFPRVIWIGLDKGAAESAALAREIDDSLSKIGFEKETREFAAHLTIGRVRSPKNKEALKEKIATAQVTPPSPSPIASVILFQSTLTPKGSIYTKLYEAKLA